MNVDLSIQEREVIKQYAKSMLTLFRRELGSGNPNATGVDAASVAFWERLINKMEIKASDFKNYPYRGGP